MYTFKKTTRLWKIGLTKDVRRPPMQIYLYVYTVRVEQPFMKLFNIFLYIYACIHIYRYMYLYIPNRKRYFKSLFKGGQIEPYLGDVPTRRCFSVQLPYMVFVQPLYIYIYWRKTGLYNKVFTKTNPNFLKKSKFWQLEMFSTSDYYCL